MIRRTTFTLALLAVTAGCNPNQLGVVNAHQSGLGLADLTAEQATELYCKHGVAGAIDYLGADNWFAIIAAGDGTVPDCGPVTPTAPAVAPGWWDTGNGVALPACFELIRWRESRHNYAAQNPRSSASGAWQFLDGTWRGVTGQGSTYDYAPGAEVGAGYSRALYAPPRIQDLVALATYRKLGTRPWAATNGGC